MLQIKEYDLGNLESKLKSEIKKIDDQILEDLEKISKIDIVKSFFIDLNKVVKINQNFSFIKASLSVIEDLKKINTNIIITDISEFNKELSLPKSSFQRKAKINKLTLNNIIEHIFGYHLEKRTQIIKKILRNIDHQNCVYCLAQYTTFYGVNNKKIYVKGNLDHIHPKSLNSLVSLSVNNLVPVCGHCNQRKLDADKSKFDFDPFNSQDQPVFNFNQVIKIDNNSVEYDDIKKLKIDNINKTLETRLDLISLYNEYKLPIINLLERYNKFNSLSYKSGIENILVNDKNITESLEYFISEIPYSDDNIQNIPLHKFKSDFYKELENYKKNGSLNFS